jgi:hypothetical protein
MEQSKRDSSWLQHCVAGDRPVLDTLMALWGSLKPLRRLQFMWDIVSDLGSLVSHGSSIDKHPWQHLGHHLGYTLVNRALRQWCVADCVWLSFFGALWVMCEALWAP